MARDHDILTELHERGVKLRLVDGRLQVQAPAGALTADLRERLRDGRDDLIALLRRTAEEELSGGITPHPEDRFEPFPLTDIQHAYWVGRGSAVELGGVSSHYYFELERDGLDADQLAAALRKVVDRHDMLRTVIRPDGRQQTLQQVPPYTMPVADLRGLPAELREKELQQTREHMDHQVLPGGRQLFDIRVSRLTDDRLRLHVSLDVLVLDGLSLYLIFQEWRRFYEEPEWSPAPLTLTFRDYVLHERAAQAGARYTADEEYWLSRLESLPDAPRLPLAKQPAQVERTRFRRRQARLGPERWTALREAAKRRGITPSAVLAAAFGEVLRRWSAQPDFTLNLTLFNRPSVHAEINQVVGDFTTVVLLALHAEDNEPFATRVARVQQQLLRDVEHVAYSGVQVLRERARRMGSGPAAAMPVVFTSALALGSAGADPAEGMGFFGEEVYGITQTPQVWLDHQVAEEGGGLVYNWDCVEELFPDGLLDDMFASYQEVLDRLAGDDSWWERRGGLAELPRWQTAERRQANATEQAIPERTLCGLVEEQALRTPHAPAVIAQDGGLTYGELLDQARRLARCLAAGGARRNTLVGVVADRGRSQAPAVLGIQLAGAAYLPVDPGWPAQRRAAVLDQGGVELVVTTPRLRDRLEWPAGVRLITLEDEEVRGAPAEALPRLPEPADLAYVIFTSGSTGTPKGVVIDHRGAANTVQDINRRFSVGPGDRVLALSSLSFDLSVYDLFGVLAAGGTVVMPAPGGAPDPEHWAELVARHHVTIWNSVPALMQAAVDARPVDGAGAPGSTVRLVLLSGDWIPVALPGAVRAAHPGAQVVGLGGATEASIWSVHHPIGTVPASWTRIPYGKPLANQDLHILDRALEPCPAWVSGEIWIGGAGVAKGYWADPERTAERFVVHPRTGRRLYRTGDLGRYLPGGDIDFLGRQDSQVKLNGYRIELGEIEAQLTRLPGVSEAVVGVDTNPATGRRQLVAHVVPARKAAQDEDRADDAAARAAVAAARTELRERVETSAGQIAAYRTLWHAMEELCPPIMARTLGSLGFFRTDGATATAEEIVAAPGVKPQYTRLVGHWLRALAESGVLEVTGEASRYRSPRALDTGALDERIREGLESLRQTGEQPDLVGYFTSCAAAQGALLRGEASPLQLLLPGGDVRVTEALYAGNPVSRLQNQVTASAVAAFARNRSAHGRTRILEIGAGTGATSAEVLAALAAGGEGRHLHYHFTDISSYFTERAKSRFSAFPFVDYGLLDIDRETAAQGHAAGSADVVIAANVLHDAKDLDRTLGRLRDLLSPGGLLVAIEGTATSLLQLVTVGFIEGLAQEHTDDRQALLSVPEWRQRLDRAGFTAVSSVPEGEPAVDVHVQHVLVAQAPAGAAESADPAVLRSALEETLPDYMVPRHYLAVGQLPLSPNGKVDRSALPTPWEEAAPGSVTGPRDELERRLHGIWRDALARDDFGVEDNFFELGGDSLHAVGILGRLRDELGLATEADEGLEMLFDHPTIAELAVLVRERTGA